MRAPGGRSLPEWLGLASRDIGNAAVREGRVTHATFTRKWYQL